MDKKYISLYIKQHNLDPTAPTVMTPILAREIAAYAGISTETTDELISKPPQSLFIFEEGKTASADPVTDLLGTCLAALANGASLAAVDAYCISNAGCTFGIVLALYVLGVIF